MVRLKNTLYLFLAMGLTAFLLKRALGVFAITVPLLFMFFDVSYSIQTLWICLKYYLFKPRIDPLSSSVMDFHVLSEDLDIFRHMNNSRYLRMMDFARFKFYLESGLYSLFKKRRSSAVLVASTIRYRRSLELFHKVQLKTKLLYWDDKAFYFEQCFVCENDFTCTIAYAKMQLIQPKSFKKADQDTPGNLLAELVHETESSELVPPLPPKELEHWIAYNTHSSLALRSLITDE